MFFKPLLQKALQLPVGGTVIGYVHCPKPDETRHWTVTIKRYAWEPGKIQGLVLSYEGPREEDGDFFELGSYYDAVYLKSVSWKITSQCVAEALDVIYKAVVFEHLTTVIAFRDKFVSNAIHVEPVVAIKIPNGKLYVVGIMFDKHSGFGSIFEQEGVEKDPKKEMGKARVVRSDVPLGNPHNILEEIGNIAVEWVFGKYVSMLNKALE